MQKIAVIMDHDVIRAFLKSIGNSTDPPEFAPPRYPKQGDLEFESVA